jgi:mono/diheme cytochrome c family protein
MVRKPGVHFAAILAACAALMGVAVPASAASDPAVPAAAASQGGDDADARWALIDRYCTECHNVTDWAGGVAFDAMSVGEIPQDAKIWEAAIRKLRGGFMPPPGAKQHPDSQAVKGLVSWLENTLDTAQVDPHPGRVPLRRLNRREYANAVRDLVGLRVDVATLLPADDRKDGFDNIAASLQVSPSFLDQYLFAARQVALQAVGNPKAPAVTTTYGPVADMVISLPPRGTPGEGTQQLYKEGMPFGTRGGMSVEHIFPADGEYALTIGDMALGRDVPRMEFKNTVVALLDGKEFFRTDIGGEADQKSIDQLQDPAVAAINGRLRNISFHTTAGQHRIAVAFLKRSFAESDERIRTVAVEGGQERVQAVHALQIRGPLAVTGVSGSPSRAKIFVCHPAQADEEAPCARKIIGTLAQRAFRRPVTDDDLHPLMAFYEAGRQNVGNDAGFDAGVRDALSAILASPHFLYRAESADEAGGTKTLSDLELASRLSFFIWSSLPDDELRDLAARSELGKPDVLAQQVRRMLADPRAKSLIDDFAFQWLNLAKLDEIVPERGQFPQASGFLDPRPMFREELERFIDSVLRSDQPVTELLTATYSFLNEPLAMLYGIENVKGGQFRRVALEDSKRYGLLGKGAILMLTANPDRTAPVLRGAWILERILGTPPATPPPNVNNLKDQVRGKPASMRERMAQHSQNPSCHACHGVMDPLGFALENFDTVGQYRARDPLNRTVLDTSGTLPDGTQLKGPDDLRRALAARPDQFVQTLTEKLMTYALGRTIDYRDMPTVRHIVRSAAQDQYRFSSIVLQIVSSDAFRKREASTPTSAPELKTASIEKASLDAGGK